MDRSGEKWLAGWKRKARYAPMASAVNASDPANPNVVAAESTGSRITGQ